MSVKSAFFKARMWKFAVEKIIFIFEIGKGLFLNNLKNLYYY